MLSHSQFAQTIVVENHLPRTLHTHDSALEQACERIVDAGLAGAHWAIFPEGYIPGYPNWIWTVHPGDHPLLSALRAEARVCAFGGAAQAAVVNRSSATQSRTCRPSNTPRPV